MAKKIFLSLLCGLMTLTLVTGCGNNDVDTNSGNEGNVNDNSQNTDNNQQNNNTTNNNTESWGKVLQVPTKQIYFSYPEDYMVEEETKTLIIRKNEEVLVGIFYDWQTAFDGNLEGIIKNNSSRFLRDISSYSKGYLRTSTIEIKETSNTSLAGYDSLKFTGKANNQGEWDCHVYGYTLVVNDVKIMIIGLVSPKAQEAEMISQVNELTDKIAASVRTEK